MNIFNKVKLNIITLIFIIGLIIQTSADDLLQMHGFNNGISLPWHISESEEENSDFEITENGEFKIMIAKGGTNKWDIQFRHRGIIMEQGHTYNVKFKIRADKDTKIYSKIGLQGPPFSEYWNNNWNPFNLKAGQTLQVNESFTMNDPTENSCEFAFHCGGELLTSGPVNLYFDDVYLSDPEFTQVVVIDTLPIKGIRVNQVGYLPLANKHATIVSSNTKSLSWKLLDDKNETVDQGISSYFGYDEASHDTVHTIDFSNFTSPGKDYTLEVNGKKSFPFNINENIYSEMRYDALAYFYHNRSAIKIEMPYAGRPDLARPAGHPTDIAATWPGTGQPNYSLDVTGGWYDAGDHGKYVVNGGVALWTMLNQYEIAKLQGNSSLSAIADGKMNIPEKNNGIPDLLDEARWEMEFILKMVVPDGNPMAGMVHHKIHDEKWTPLAVAPHEDEMTRYLRPVSTAATLNLVATAAQAGRIYSDFDEQFAQKCMDAAEKSWKVALKFPKEYAPIHKIGGGPYNDSYVLDEFYWAASELYISTGKSEYLNYIKSSPHYMEIPTKLSYEDEGLTGVFTWASTQALGTISLAITDNHLDPKDLQKAHNNISSAADNFLAIIEKEGYRTPIEIGPKGYPWGSNSFIINESVLLGIAHFINGDSKYLSGISESLDHILGCNAMDQSYVTGYGERALNNPHHRFWAVQANPKFPAAPAGALSGGPNSGVEDSWAKGAGLLGKPPAKTFIDHIESWATNEITINWNAPFAWSTAYLDDHRNFSGSKVNINTINKSIHKVGIIYNFNGTQIKLKGLQHTKNSIRFYGLNGRVIHKANITSSKGTINLSTKELKLAQGIYIFTIDNAMQTFRQKLIIR